MSKQHHKIPATVVTGFLGAGKTTLLRHLVATANGRRLAIIVNEFGDVGIDGEILRACGDEACGDDDIVELTNGCLCCTVADDFVPTMQALIDRPEPPDHIVIETSGLALPKPLIRAFNWPEIRTRVTVDGVVAVVDGPAVVEGRFAADEAAVAAQRTADPALDHDSPLEELFEDQLGSADLVVVNKTDLMADGDHDVVAETLGRYARGAARTIRASHGTIDASVLLGLDAAAEDDLDSRPSHHDSTDDHDHDDFDSFVVALDTVSTPDDLLDRLAPVLADHDILRLKGFAAVDGKPMRLVVQAVGRRIQHYFDRDWHADEARRTELVVIGQRGLDRAAIVRALAG